MELVEFLESCKALENFYSDCTDEEKKYLDSVAIVANSKISYSTKLLAIGEGIEKVLQQRRNL